MTHGRSITLLLLLAAAAAAACSGSSSSDSPPTPLTGVFVDAPVAGLHYRTATQSGTTDAQGRYQYLPGETVTFSIGAIQLAPVKATGIVSPLTVFGTDDPEYSTSALNLARLLQSLDSDGITANGIAIGEEAHAAATQEVDFGSASFDDAVLSLVTIARGDVDATLVSSTVAIAHLEQQFALVGAWVAGAGNDAIVITFLGDGRYAIAHGGTADAAGQPGVEFGTYTWNAETHEFTADAKRDPLSDTNGEWGFSHPGANGERGTVSALVTVSGSEATLFDPLDDATMTFTRIYDAGSAIVGSWTGQGDPGADDAAVLTLLADGTYALASGGQPDAEQGWPGVEFGTYEWDPSGAFTAYPGPPALNTDGEWGFTGVDQLPNPGAAITIENGIMSFHADGTVHYFKRIGRK